MKTPGNDNSVGKYIRLFLSVPQSWTRMSLLTLPTSVLFLQWTRIAFAITVTKTCLPHPTPPPAPFPTSPPTEGGGLTSTLRIWGLGVRLLPTDASNSTGGGVKEGASAQVNAVTPGPSLLPLAICEVRQDGSASQGQAMAMTRPDIDHKASPLHCCVESARTRSSEKRKKFVLLHFKPFVVELTTVSDMS